MRSALILFITFLTTSTILNAQDRQITRKTNILGEVITAFRSGDKVVEVKESTDIFGDKIVTMKGADGFAIYTSKTSTDMLGNKLRDIRTRHGEKTLLLKRSTDIFGDTTVTVYRNGSITASMKASTDILGDRSKIVTGPAGNTIYSIKESVDIFGDTTVTFSGNADMVLVGMMLDFLREP